MVDRNRELVPDNWSAVRERALTQIIDSDNQVSHILAQ